MNTNTVKYTFTLVPDRRSGELLFHLFIDAPNILHTACNGKDAPWTAYNTHSIGANETIQQAFARVVAATIPQLPAEHFKLKVK